MVECEFLANENGVLVLMDFVKTQFDLDVLSSLRIYDLDTVNYYFI
jgi:hypothetical protein